MIPLRSLLLAVALCAVFTHVEADFSRRYMHAVDQLFRGLLSSTNFQKNVDEINAKREELGSQLFQAYNGFMSNGKLDLSKLKLPSMGCLSDLMQVVGAARSGSPPQWALRFADAMFKPPAGLLDGNLNWLGAFDECNHIVVDEEYIKTTGKYCLVPLFMDNSTSTLKDAVPGSTEGLNLGVCLPASCTTGDIASLVDMLNGMIHSNSYFNATGVNLFTRPDRMRCHDPKLPYSRYFIAATVVIGIIVLLNILSTIYDVVLRYWGNCEFHYAPLSGLETPSNPRPATISPIQMQTPSALTVENEHGGSSTYGDRANLIEKPPSMAVSPLNAATTSVAAETCNSNLPPHTISSGKTSKCREILLSFSFIRNGQKLLSTSNIHQSRSMLNFGAIHGIRLISLMWVILGHTFILPMATVDNIMPVLNFTRHFEFQVVNQALLAVDTFFVLSGFLLGYVALRQIEH